MRWCVLSYCTLSDYNITMWKSGADKSANHYQAAALECKQYCDNDPKCCAWT